MDRSAHVTKLSSSKPLELPVEPGPEDCCQRGCKVCVWDVYRDKLQAYKDYMQQHHPDVPLPSQMQQASSQQHQAYEASMDAFELLERQLQQQQQQQ